MRIMSLAAAAALTLALSAVAFADAPAPSEGVQKFGAPVTETKAVELAKLIKKPASFAEKTLRVEGTVKDVCQGQGCWMEIQDAKGKTFIVKSLDESVLVPKDIKGQKVVVQGVFTSKPAKGHDHSHDAAEAAHSCPSPTWVLDTKGVELMAKK